VTERPAPASPVAATNTLLAKPVLEARDLTKHFPLHGGLRFSARRRPPGRGAPAKVVHAVDDVTLTLARGTVTAVVGESGSGKSTLARMLAGLIKPTSGELMLDGAAIHGTTGHGTTGHGTTGHGTTGHGTTGHGARGHGPTGRDYARQVQMVLQDPFSSLNPVHDVRYHLARPLLVHKLATQDQLDEQITALLERVSLTPGDAYLHKYPHELSGGQRQRVAIARALAVRPRVLLADEPVSMLDVSIRLGVLNLLGDLRDRDQLAILYITHDIASARYLADDIMVMYAGRVVEAGPAEQVTDQPSHPYTQLLLSAAPDPSRAERESLRGRGAPPSQVAPPSGCRFHPRCPFAMPVCAERTPPPFLAGSGHTSACWLLDPARADTAQASTAQASTSHGSTADSAGGVGEESV
jgi:peptide/nickel transport system ATP-binding protein